MRADDVHHAEDAPLAAQRDGEERPADAPLPLLQDEALLALHVGHVDGLAARGCFAGDPLAEMEAHPPHRRLGVAGDGLDDQLMARLVEQHDAELDHSEAGTHLFAQHVELLGEIERAGDRLGHLEEQLHLADVAGQAGVDRLQLFLQLQLLVGLDVVHRLVGDAREHGVEAARELPELVLALDASTDEELAQLGARHHPLERLDGLDQEVSRRQCDGDPGEGQRQERAQHRSVAQLAEGAGRIDRRDPARMRDQRPEASDQRHRRRDRGGEDELEGERAAQLLPHGAAILSPQGGRAGRRRFFPRAATHRLGLPRRNPRCAAKRS